MDKNSIIGLLLIAAILIGYSVWNTPSQEEIEAARIKQDSIATVQAEKKAIQNSEIFDEAPLADAIPDSLENTLLNEKLRTQFGVFANAAVGEAEYWIYENELLRLKISSKGGRIVSAELKNYKTYDSLPLYLFEEKTSAFAFNFKADNTQISTGDLFFTPINEPKMVTGEDSSSFTLRMDAGQGRYIDYVYGLKGNSYLLNFDVIVHGLNDVISQETKHLDLNWSLLAPDQEKSMENQRMNTTIYFKNDDGVDYLSETSDDKAVLEKPTTWVGLKQQFFSTVIINEQNFEQNTSVIESAVDPNEPEYVKRLSASLGVKYNHTKTEKYDMALYLGPNHYQTLKRNGFELQHIVPLGWGIFGWVNQFLVIPVFNMLAGFDMSFGIVILILTLIIKLVLFPLTYKAYLSTAKMKVLKPEIDELNKKFSKDEAMKKQQAVMALYKKAGVSPFGGCIPMLLQFPILIALFRFFPASIELRQQSFLWAEDLSTFDSIASLPFNIPFYGDHVSLFTILMTISTILYTRMNSQLSASPEMAQMKWMMYLMPIIFLGVFNNYAAGLSYYYFLANIITFGQQFAMQRMVDDKALLAKIEVHKQRPDSDKKSSFQQRLEDAAKKRGYKMPKK
ncbi:MAG: membrane protein insertase YidC [Bacteroidetes bacterium]|nr:membrane protein insertase YidC [Bacteroidota bacterium]HET6245256.1 membrane protein insertase YidC [Bacteroidia bacterium]